MNVKNFCVVRESNLAGKQQFEVARVAKVLRPDHGDGEIRAAVRFHSHIDDGNYERFVRVGDIFQTLREAKEHAAELAKAQP